METSGLHNFRVLYTHKYQIHVCIGILYKNISDSSVYCYKFYYVLMACYIAIFDSIFKMLKV